MDAGQDQDWQTYKTSVSARTGHLLDTGLYSDVTLAVGHTQCQQEFKVHKNILAMSSPVFEAMFYGSLAEDSVVQITDIKPETFQKLLMYIYKDTLDLMNIVEAWDLWYAANKYLLRHLAQQCLTDIEDKMTDFYVMYTLEKSMEYNLPDLEAKCLRFIDIHADVILKSHLSSNRTTDFFHAMKESILKIISRPLLTATEVEIFKAVKEWGFLGLQREGLPVTPESLRDRIGALLPYIRFHNMTPDKFMELVVPSGLLTPEQLNENLLVLMRKLLPSHKEETYRKYAVQVCCERGTLYSRCSQIEKSDHFLKFKIYTSRELSCLLTGLRVAKAHTDSPCMFCQREKYLHHLHNDRESLHDEEDEDDEEDGTERRRLTLSCSVSDYADQQLAYFDGALTASQYDVDFTTPVSLQSGTFYTICVRVLENVSLCCCRGNCKQKVNCGELTVEFYSDPRSPFTNVNTGLITHLFFYMPKGTGCLPDQESAAASASLATACSDPGSSQPLDLKCEKVECPAPPPTPQSSAGEGSSQVNPKRMRTK